MINLWNDSEICCQISMILKEHWLYTFQESAQLLLYGAKGIDPNLKLIEVNHCSNCEKTHSIKRIDSIIHLKLYYINSEVVLNVKRFIIESEEIGKIIVDIRECCGGDISASIELAKILLGTFKFKIVMKRDEIIHSENNKTNFTSIVALIGKGTVSAAELLAGLIHEDKRGLLIGDQNSFGKNTIQKIFNINSFLNLEITVAKFVFYCFDFKPEGLKPDIVLPRFKGTKYINLRTGHSYKKNDNDPNIMSIQLILEELLGVNFVKYGTLDYDTLKVFYDYVDKDYKEYISGLDMKVLKSKYHDFLLRKENDSHLNTAIEYLAEVKYDS